MIGNYLLFILKEKLIVKLELITINQILMRNGCMIYLILIRKDREEKEILDQILKLHHEIRGNIESKFEFKKNYLVINSFIILAKTNPNFKLMPNQIVVLII